MEKSFAISIICLAISIAAYSLSSMYNAAMKSIGMNPSAAQDIKGMIIIGAGFIEALGLLCFALAYMVLQ